jgi:hypothetical protein
MRRSSLGFICLCIILGCSGLAGAATYYVAPPASGGSDSNPGTIGSPWATWGKAVATAVAGDTVYFRAGTHTVSAAAVTAHSGTSASPITLKAYPGETPTITANGIAYCVRVQNPYWTFDGLSFIASNLPDHSSAIIKITNYAADHAVIQNCNFQALSAAGHDNIACIILEASYADYALIQNNTIMAIHDTNGAGIGGIEYMGITGATGVKVLHNIIHCSSRGLYIKHANGDTSFDTGAEIAYNYIYDCPYFTLSGNPAYVNFHDNLLVGSGTALSDGGMQGEVFFGQNGGGPMGHDNIFNHNTIYKASLYQDNSAGPITYTNATNNVFMALTIPAAWRTPTTPHYTTLDYNLYINGTAFVEYATGYTLATWKTHYGQDAHSLAGTPTFVGGTTPVTIADYALAAGSLGKNAASDGKDMGADISLVGLQSPAPTAVNDSYSVYANHTLTVPAATGLLLNDTGSGTLTAVKVTDPSHGSLSLNSDGGFVYTSTTDYSGSDSFTYKAHNASGDSNTATVSITINQPTRVLVDVGLDLLSSTTSPNSDGRYWNNFSSYNSSPSIITSCTTANGSLSGIKLTRTANFYYYGISPSVTAPINGWPINAAKDFFSLSSTTVPSVMEFSMLDTTGSKTYDLTVFGSISATGTTRYTVLTSSTTSRDINTNGNTTQWATFRDLTADPNGKITLQALLLTNGGRGALNVIDLAIYNNGGAGDAGVNNTIAGDVTCDGYVDGGDLNVLLSNWNSDIATWITGDLTGDGYVDGGDLNILLSNWNAQASPAVGNAMNSETIATSASTQSVETSVSASVVQNAQLSIQINFQPASVIAPQGYLVDSGKPFGKSDNGYTYGWTTDLSSFAVQCNNAASLDVRYDTAIMLVAGGTWEMSVPNGMYDVKIVSGVGDSGSLSAQKFTVEGVPATQIQSQAQANATSSWSEETVTVVVTDGRLTIIGQPGSSLCFVQITGR